MRDGKDRRKQNKKRGVKGYDKQEGREQKERNQGKKVENSTKQKRRKEEGEKKMTRKLQ